MGVRFSIIALSAHRHCYSSLSKKGNKIRFAAGAVLMQCQRDPRNSSLCSISPTFSIKGCDFAFTGITNNNYKGLN